MKLSTEYIVNHLDEYLTEENGDWNQIHGGWNLDRKHEIKKYVYAIMPFFESDGKICANKVIKVFIINGFNGIQFTSSEISGPHNMYYGKYVQLTCTHNELCRSYCEHFALFDTKSEAQEALKTLLASKQNDVLNRQIMTIKNEIDNLQNKLKIKQEKLDTLMKKLNVTQIE